MLDRPHRRYNPLLDEWVLCSPQRLERPWQGRVEDAAVHSRPRYDPGCYLCPGNARAGGQRNPSYAGTFAFDNDFPALLAETAPAAEILPAAATVPAIATLPTATSAPAVKGVPAAAEVPAPEGAPPAATPAESASSGLLAAAPASGRCRVICFSPRHDLTLAEMDQAEVRTVVETWAGETAALGALPAIRHVQVFENKGESMGCSNPHPHCQVWATDYVPLIPARKLASQRAFFERHGRDLLGVYLERELAAGERLVCRNEHWVALVPWWAVWPFEVMLLPVRRVGGLPGLSEDERDALADILRRICARYDNLFSTSFPYSMGFHGRPSDGHAHEHWRLHAVFLPPLLRSASVRKFLVGFELTAEPQRDLTAEQAAARLREQSETHYRAAAGEAPSGATSE